MYAKTPRREGREGVKHQELMMGGWRGVGEVKAGEADGSWTTQDLVGRIQEPGLPWGHHPTGSSSREGGHISPRAIFTSSVLASIFLWVRASRRTHGWTPRS